MEFMDLYTLPKLTVDYISVGDAHGMRDNVEMVKWNRLDNTVKVT